MTRLGYLSIYGAELGPYSLPQAAVEHGARQSAGGSRRDADKEVEPVGIGGNRKKRLQ